MAKKKVESRSIRDSAKSPKPASTPKKRVAVPSLSGTLPTPVAFQPGSITRFTVTGTNLFGTTKVPVPLPEPTLSLWSDLGQHIYDFQEPFVSIFDGGPAAFVVQAKWGARKKPIIKGSGKLRITIQTGSPKKTISGSFRATIN